MNASRKNVPGIVCAVLAAAATAADVVAWTRGARVDAALITLTALGLAICAPLLGLLGLRSLDATRLGYRTSVASFGWLLWLCGIALFAYGILHAAQAYQDPLVYLGVVVVAGSLIVGDYVRKIH